MSINNEKKQFGIIFIIIILIVGLIVGLILVQKSQSPVEKAAEITGKTITCAWSGTENYEVKVIDKNGKTVAGPEESLSPISFEVENLDLQNGPFRCVLTKPGVPACVPIESEPFSCGPLPSATPTSTPGPKGGCYDACGSDFPGCADGYNCVYPGNKACDSTQGGTGCYCYNNSCEIRLSPSPSPSPTLKPTAKLTPSATPTLPPGVTPSITPILSSTPTATPKPTSTPPPLCPIPNSPNGLKIQCDPGKCYWNSVSNASTYKVSIINDKTNQPLPEFAPFKRVNITNVTFTAQPGITYRCIVESENSCGSSPAVKSDVCTITIPGQPSNTPNPLTATGAPSQPSPTQMLVLKTNSPAPQQQGGPSAIPPHASLAPSAHPTLPTAGRWPNSIAFIGGLAIAAILIIAGFAL